MRELADQLACYETASNGSMLILKIGAISFGEWTSNHIYYSHMYHSYFPVQWVIRIEFIRGVKSNTYIGGNRYLLGAID